MIQKVVRKTIAQNKNDRNWNSVDCQLGKVALFNAESEVRSLVDVNFFYEEGCHCGDEKQDNSPKEFVFLFAFSHVNFRARSCLSFSHLMASVSDYSFL